MKIHAKRETHEKTASKNDIGSRVRKDPLKDAKWKSLEK